MIQTFRRIGRIKMDQDSWQQMNELERKMYVLGMFCHDQESFVKREKEEDLFGRILTVNLDTKGKTISLVLGNQIAAMGDGAPLIFTKYAPGDPSIYYAHHDLGKIMSFDLHKTIKGFNSRIPWTQSEKSEEFLAHLLELGEAFFIEEGKDLVMDIERFEPDQREWLKRNYFEWEQNLEHDLNKKPKDYIEAVKECFYSLLGADAKAPNAFAFTIDGQYLIDGEFGEPYADALLFYLINKQYDHKGKSPCHGCSKEDILAKKLSIPLKFFGSTNPLFFDGVKNNNAYLSFSLCRDCNVELLYGMKYSRKKLSFYLLGLPTIVLPEFGILVTPDPSAIEHDTMDLVVRLLRRMDQRQALANAQNLLKRVKRFTLMFHGKLDPTSQEFVIHRFIPSIELESLLKKTQHFVKLNDEYRLTEMNQSLSIEALRYMIIPSSESHALKFDDYIKLNKEVTSLLSTYLQDSKFSAPLLIKSFVDIFNRKHIRDKSGSGLRLTPFVLTLYLEHLRSFNLLQGERKGMVKELTVKLLDENLKEYFENSSVYSQDTHAQGLFILGKFLRAVEKAMRAKKIKKTIVHRLNLRGIPANKIMSVSAMIMESMKVWECYIDLPLHAYYNEAIADIKDSTLTPEEIVFHILNGRAFEAYQEKLYFLNQPDKQVISEEETDDN